MVYIVRGQKKSLLGRLNLEALGIITFNQRSRQPYKEVKAVTMMTTQEDRQLIGLTKDTQGYTKLSVAAEMDQGGLLKGTQLVLPKI